MGSVKLDSATDDELWTHTWYSSSDANPWITADDCDESTTTVNPAAHAAQRFNNKAQQRSKCCSTNYVWKSRKQVAFQSKAGHPRTRYTNAPTFFAPVTLTLTRWPRYIHLTCGGTAAAMTQNEQTADEHSTLEQQPPGRLDVPAHQEWAL